MWCKTLIVVVHAGPKPEENPDKSVRKKHFICLQMIHLYTLVWQEYVNL